MFSQDLELLTQPSQLRSRVKWNAVGLLWNSFNWKKKKDKKEKIKSPLCSKPSCLAKKKKVFQKIQKISLHITILLYTASRQHQGHSLPFGEAECKASLTAPNTHLATEEESESSFNSLPQRGAQ